jgi:hypothetical protein
VNDLHDLLHDAVAGVEPAERLDELRARTANPARAAARPWWWAAGATVLATAATVAVVAVVSNGSDAPGHHHHDMAMDPPGTTQLVAAYYWGMAPNGTHLFREFDEVPAGDPLQAALDRIQQPPDDPDYHSAFPPGSFAGVSLGESTIKVEVADPDAGVSGVAVQQVVYTLQAAAGERWPVEFFHAGQLVGRPVTASPARLSPVNISDPAEGNEYAGSFTARGRVRSSEKTLGWRLVVDRHTVVASGSATIEPGQGSFSPWSAEIDLSGLAPGRYAFTVWTGRVGYGTGPFTDTRTIVVQ